MFLFVCMFSLLFCFQLYEGLKAYRGSDEKIRIFRPELNMVRMKTTAHRATLPVSELALHMV